MTYRRLQRTLVVVVAAAAAVGVKTKFGICLHPGRCACSWGGVVCAVLKVRELKIGGVLQAYQFTVEATCVTIELIIEATAPQRSVSCATVRAFCLDTPRSGMRSRLITSEACAGNVGRASVLRLDAQGGPFVRLGIDIRERWELVHGRSQGSQGSHVGEGRGGGQDIGWFGLVGVSGLHIDIFGLEVFMKTGG